MAASPKFCQSFPPPEQNFFLSSLTTFFLASFGICEAKSSSSSWWSLGQLFEIRQLSFVELIDQRRDAPIKIRLRNSDKQTPERLWGQVYVAPSKSYLHSLSHRWPICQETKYKIDVKANCPYYDRCLAAKIPRSTPCRSIACLFSGRIRSRRRCWGVGSLSSSESLAG